jgi:hypothetical protein
MLRFKQAIIRGAFNTQSTGLMPTIAAKYNADNYYYDFGGECLRRPLIICVFRKMFKVVPETSMRVNRAKCFTSFQSQNRVVWLYV